MQLDLNRDVVLHGDDDWKRYVFSAGEVVYGNCAALLVDGGPTFERMLQAIGRAQRTVCLETYIYEADFVGERFAKALEAAAARGVECALLVDAVGSTWLPTSFVERLEAAGVQVHVFRPIASRRPARYLVHRDHRKMLIVDGLVAFVGGINIHAEAAPRSEGGQGWHDFAVELEGPIVRRLLHLFIETWHAPKLRRFPRLRVEDDPPHVSRLGEVALRLIATDQVRGRWAIRRAILYAVRRARQRVRIANAYFIPDAGVVRCLAAAAKRGVDVTIMLPARSDVPIVDVAGGAVYDRLLKAGVKIHLWKQGVLHAKVAVVDDVWAMVGSYNLDWFSLLRNREVVVTLLDRGMACELGAELEADLAHCDEVTRELWAERPAWKRYLAEPIAYRLRRYL